MKEKLTLKEYAWGLLKPHAKEFGFSDEFVEELKGLPIRNSFFQINLADKLHSLFAHLFHLDSSSDTEQICSRFFSYLKSEFSEEQYKIKTYSEYCEEYDKAQSNIEEEMKKGFDADSSVVFDEIEKKKLLNIIDGENETLFDPSLSIGKPFFEKEASLTKKEAIAPNYYDINITNAKGETINCDVFDIANAMNLSLEQFNTLKYFRVKGNVEKQINDTEKGIKCLERHIDRLKQTK